MGCLFPKPKPKKNVSFRNSSTGKGTAKQATDARGTSKSTNNAQQEFSSNSKSKTSKNNKKRNKQNKQSPQNNQKTSPEKKRKPERKKSTPEKVCDSGNEINETLLERTSTTNDTGSTEQIEKIEEPQKVGCESDINSNVANMSNEKEKDILDEVTNGEKKVNVSLQKPLKSDVEEEKQTEKTDFSRNISKHMEGCEKVKSADGVTNAEKTVNASLQEESVVENNIQNLSTETQKTAEIKLADLSRSKSKSTEEYQEASSANDINKTIGSAANATNILDLQSHFKHSQFNDVNIPNHSLEFIEEIRKRAELFEEKVEKHNSPEDSVEYFIIEENLMRFVEELDKMRCHNNKALLRRKIEILKYIEKLQKQLDVNAAKSIIDTRVLEEKGDK